MAAHLKRNRSQKRSSNVYQLETLYRPTPSGLGTFEAALREGATGIIDFADLKTADVADVLFVAVPVTTTTATCEALRDSIRVALGDKHQVMVITNNVEFLKAKRLKPSETAKVLSNIEEMTHAEANTGSKLIVTPDDLRH